MEVRSCVPLTQRKQILFFPLDPVHYYFFYSELLFLNRRNAGASRLYLPRNNSARERGKKFSDVFLHVTWYKTPSSGVVFRSNLSTGLFDRNPFFDDDRHCNTRFYQNTMRLVQIIQ